MPVWDLVATLKIVARYAIIFGLILAVGAFANTLGNAILSLWTIINNGVNDFQNLMNSGSSSSSASCFFFYIHALGIDAALTSLILGVVGLGTSWGGVIILINGYQVMMYGKHLLIEGTK
jgi:hypothetical protein